MKRAAATAAEDGTSAGRQQRQSGNDQGPSPSWTKVGPGGRIVIPAPMRRALDLEEGADVQIRMDGDTVSLVPQDVVVRAVQDTVSDVLESDKASVDAFLAERSRLWDEEGSS